VIGSCGLLSRLPGDLAFAYSAPFAHRAMILNSSHFHIGTGGTGLVGSGIRWQVEENNYRPKGAKFVFLSSKDADLRDMESTRAAFQKHKPTHVIHLAARVVQSPAGVVATNGSADSRRSQMTAAWRFAGRTFQEHAVQGRDDGREHQHQSERARLRARGRRRPRGLHDVDLRLPGQGPRSPPPHHSASPRPDARRTAPPPPTPNALRPRVSRTRAQIAYPITEDTLHDGPPHPSNEGYAYAKRMVEARPRPPPNVSV